MWNVKLITMRVMALKKIKLEESNVTQTVKGLETYVNYFNSLDADTEFVLGRETSKIQILRFISEFLYPNTVRPVAGNRKTKDVLKRADKLSDAEVAKLSYSEFMLLQETFVGYFKKDVSECNTISLAEVRSDVSINDVFSRACFGIREGAKTVKKVRYSEEPFIPVELTQNLCNLFENMYFNADVKDVVDHYISDASLY